MTAISATSGAITSTATQTPDRKQLKQAAQQFEAILTRQMLAEARKTNFDNELFSSDGVNTFREMMDSRFADVTSQSGALGFAKMIEKQIDKVLPKGVIGGTGA